MFCNKTVNYYVRIWHNHLIGLNYWNPQKVKKGRKILVAVILCLFIINGINRTLLKLENKQMALAYNIYVLNKQIKEDEYSLLHNNI